MTDLLHETRTTRMKQASKPPMLISLDDARAKSLDLAGAKASTLARLKADGFVVPNGFVITTAACAAVRARGEVPVQLRSEIERSLFDGAVAVRSSGAAEDGVDASYAGQFTTVLGVDGIDDVVHAVRACIQSTELAGAASDRENRDSGGFAVLIQPMVDARAAGVAFSADPVTGARDTAVVSAVVGLGDRLVDGTATPDEWLVRNGCAEARVTGENAIDAARAVEVAGLARRLEQQLGRPQDIEWAIDGDTVWLLQSRPITALPVEPAIDVPPGPWSKDTTHFPEPLTPFGESVYMEPWAESIASMAKRWGLMIGSVTSRSFSGEVYTQALGLNGKPETSSPPPWWLIGIVARLAPPMRRRLKAAATAMASGDLESAAERWEAHLRPMLEAKIAELVRIDVEEVDDAALAAHIDDVLALHEQGSHIHFDLMMPYLIGMHRLVVVCRDLLGWEDARALQLVQGLSVASSAPARQLRDLGERIRANPAAAAAVRESTGNLVNALCQFDSELADALDDFSRRWGLRTTRYDPGAPSLSEDGRLFTQLIADEVGRSDSSLDRASELRQQAIADARNQLSDRSAGDQKRFQDALELARSVYPSREDNVLFTDNLPCGLLRRSALEIGRRLVGRSRIDHAGDAAWLTLDELLHAMKNVDADADLRALARRRRAERRWIAAHPGPVFRGSEPPPPPNLRGLPSAARETNEAILWGMALELTPAGGSGDDARLAGIGASAGTYTGTVRIVHDERDFSSLRPGDVLVCAVTTPSWSILFANAGALVTDGGGVLSHAAIIAREHGIPAVLGTVCATSRLKSGQRVRVDGTTGRVTLVE